VVFAVVFTYGQTGQHSVYATTHFQGGLTYLRSTSSRAYHVFTIVHFLYIFSFEGETLYNFFTFINTHNSAKLRKKWKYTQITFYNYSHYLLEFYYSMHNQYELFIYLNLMAKSSDIHIKRYFK
jgi:hypothetical protein